MRLLTRLAGQTPATSLRTLSLSHTHFATAATTTMPTAVPVAKEIILGRPKPLKPIDPKTRKMMYRAKGTPPVVTRTHDIYVEFEDGSTVIDAFGGAAVAMLGFDNEEVMDAIDAEQRKTGFVYGAFFSHTAGEELASFLVDQSKGDFAGCNFIAGGSEAVESALKTARQYWWEKGQKEKTKFIGRHMSYHGNTIGALSVAYHPGKRAPFESFINKDIYHYVSPAHYLHYGKEGESEEDYATRLADELDAKITELGPETVAAFFIEPMVASSQGAVLPPRTYFQKVRAVCDKHDVLLVYDEIMCGMWRTGKMFAYHRIGEGTKPDILTAAKGLGAGYVPIGVMFAGQKIIDAIHAGSGFWNHGFTYTAFTTACAGALAVQKIMVRDNFEERIPRLEEQLESHLKRDLYAQDNLGGFVVDVRGCGLLWAIEVQAPNPTSFAPRIAHRMQAIALEQGLVTLGMPALRMNGEGDCLMLAPHAITTPTQMRTICELAVATVKQMREELVKEGHLSPL